MHRVASWTLGGAAAILALALLVPAVAWLQSEAVIEQRFPLPSTTAAASRDAKAIIRGIHLVAIAGCSDCHGDDLEGRPVGRGTLLPVTSSNLRRDAHTLTDEEFERAIRTGITPGSTSMWRMPAMDYSFMSEDDIVAIVSYLRTLKALGAAAPRPDFTMPVRFAIARGDIVPIAARVLEDAPSLDPGPRYDGGRYLARIACSDCHGTDLSGSSSMPDLKRVAHYSRSAFFGLLRDGRAPDGRTLQAMARPRFRALHDYEIDALYDYLSARARIMGR